MANKSYQNMTEWKNNNNTLQDCCSINNSCERLLDDNSNDKYTAAIELSNKCREFYQSRLQTANSMKTRWSRSSLRQHDSAEYSDASLSSSSSSLSSDGSSTSSSRGQQRHRIDDAMDRLRIEMVSLIDQDLSLMKQLLTLNETIEELKWQHQYHNYSASWASSSVSKYLDSNLSISDTHMYDSENNFMTGQTASCNSVHSNQAMKTNWQYTRNVRSNCTDFSNISMDATSKITRPADIDTTTTISRSDCQTVYAGDSRCSSQAGEIVSIHHERSENSFDSGIHESTSGDELSWSV